MKTPQEVYDFLVNHMKKCNPSYSKWYAGIATDPRDRLFVDHNVDEENGTWAYETCATSDGARNVEKALLDLGCQGGDGGGDSSTKSCYVYLITSQTRK